MVIIYLIRSYTDCKYVFQAVVNTLFFTLFYCTIFPQGFFLGAAIMTINYWTDKHALLVSRCLFSQNVQFSTYHIVNRFIEILFINSEDMGFYAQNWS